MSLLAAYYAAIEDEKHASASLLDAQATKTTHEGNLLGYNADTARIDAQGRANANNASAGQTAANSASERNLRGAQAGLLNTQASVLPSTAASENQSRASSAGATDVGADAQRQSLDTQDDQGDEKGGKIVSEREVAQGKSNKPGPTDTVPVMLTPGEAVLNKGAAQHYGSDVIDHMNKMGLMRMAAQSEVAQHMGLPDPHAAPGRKGKTTGKKGGMPAPAPTGGAPTGGAVAPAGVPGFASGTSDVPAAAAGLTSLAAAGATATGGAHFPGFWKGTADVHPVALSALSDLNARATVGMQPQIDPTAYALGMLHGSTIGPMADPRDARQPLAARR